MFLHQSLPSDPLSIHLLQRRDIFAPLEQGSWHPQPARRQSQWPRLDDWTFIAASIHLGIASKSWGLVLSDSWSKSVRFLCVCYNDCIYIYIYKYDRWIWICYYYCSIISCDGTWNLAIWTIWDHPSFHICHEDDDRFTHPNLPTWLHMLPRFIYPLTFIDIASGTHQRAFPTSVYEIHPWNLLIHHQTGNIEVKNTLGE